MVEGLFDPILAIALEVDELLQLPGVREQWVRNLQGWNEARRSLIAERGRHNQQLFGQLYNDEEPAGIPLGYSDDGPAPLYWNPPWSTPQCYVATGVVHDRMFDELRANTISHVVKPICPHEPAFWWFDAMTKLTGVQDLTVKAMREALDAVKADLSAVGLLTPQRADGADNGDTGDDQSALGTREIGTEVHDRRSGMKWQEAAERLEWLRQQGKSFTSQKKLAGQLGCSPATINKAIDKTASLQAWAKVDAVPKAQSINEVVLDNVAHGRESGPEDEAAIREYLEREDISPDERAFFNGLSTEDQLAFLDDPDADNRTLHQRILDRKP